MIYDGREGDIISQYVAFTKVCSEQMTLYGRTKQAILETIRICKSKNVLKEYLENREREVVDIMMVLYDEEEIMRSYLESEIYEATQKAERKAARKARKEGRIEGKIEAAKRMLEKGKLTVSEIAEYSNLPIELVEDLANNS